MNFCLGLVACVVGLRRGLPSVSEGTPFPTRSPRRCDRPSEASWQSGDHDRPADYRFAVAERVEEN